MRMKNNYPISVKMYQDERKFVFKLFRTIAPHKGVFIGVCELEGSFLCEAPEQLYGSLLVGERLNLVLDDTKRLAVQRQDGTVLGTVPHADSVLPKMLFERGVGIFAYFEAKDFINDLLTIVISLYCEKY